jgi:hypothetical protein
VRIGPGRDTAEELGTVEDDHYLRFLADRGYDHVERPHGLREEMYYMPQLSQVPEPPHYSRWVADRSVEFLRTRQPGEPFFRWSSFIHPHPPFAPPSPLLAMRDRAAGHFPELAGAGFDTENVPLSLGGPGEAETLAAIARDPDGGFLTIPDDDVAPGETFAEYRTRYREEEKS